MENHPIPQQISSYQFRLVGDMTLKQFFQVAGGALVSLIFYGSKLPGYVKWPFILFFSLLGVAMAFMPLEDRPLEQWILSFFRSVYSPTIFFWNKIQKAPSFYQEETVTVQPTTTPDPTQPKPVSPNVSFPLLDKFEEAESKFLNSIGTLFSAGASTSGETIIKPVEKPNITPGLTVPPVQPITFTKRVTPAVEKPVEKQTVSLENVSQTFQEQKPMDSVAAQFSLDAAPPSPPTVPNTIVGQIIDDKGKIIEGAIAEIRDASGRPVRALKSNKLGHFLVVTPLQNGSYQFITEKDGYTFEPVHFDAAGQLIPPIAIRGKQTVNPIVAEQN